MLTPIESDVLQAIAERNPKYKKVLENQVASITEATRDFSGVGYFLNFKLKNNSTQFDELDFELGDFLIEMDELEHGADAILFVRSGYMSFLEFVAFAEPWPTEIGNYRISD